MLFQRTQSIESSMEEGKWHWRECQTKGNKKSCRYMIGHKANKAALSWEGVIKCRWWFWINEKKRQLKVPIKGIAKCQMVICGSAYIVGRGPVPRCSPAVFGLPGESGRSRAVLDKKKSRPLRTALGGDVLQKRVPSGHRRGPTQRPWNAFRTMAEIFGWNKNNNNYKNWWLQKQPSL